MLSKRYQPQEEKIFKFWERENLFTPKKRGKKFSLVLPPPNITGSLHMGHALNVLCQDILIRKKRLEGYRTLWVPGTDHAGIATQFVVEKELKKKGLTRFLLGRKRFLKKVWAWKKKYGGVILEQLKKLGASCDFSRAIFTLDETYSKAVKEAFIYWWNKGLIYRAKRPINWCPHCKSSLSDLEVEYKKVKGKLYFIKYPLKKGAFIKLATTRPETMLGDSGVAVNPEDERYKKLVGKKAILPLLKREIPIISSPLVDPEFGTGAVKITPGHDFLDWQIAQKENLEMIQVINEERKMINVPSVYLGLSTFKAREKIINDLKKENLLEKIESYLHSVPICYRCKNILEIIPSWQWFLKMERFKKIARKVVKREKIKFIPKNFEKVYFDWLENTHDWCISRQIWWGHQIPVYFCEKGHFFSDRKRPKKCSLCRSKKINQVNDVLDTWFSSALWPFAVFGWPKKTKDLKTFYPTDVLITARDIINLWVARMIFSSLDLLKKIPFRKVFIHPTILTKEGKRMSKSLGTGIDPLILIEKFGADAVRFGISWQIKKVQDIRFSIEPLKMGEKFLNKIWNATRFIFSKTGKIKKGKDKFSKMDREILKKLKEVQRKWDKFLERFEFGKSAEIIYHFFWHQFCDNYIEISKIQLKEKKETTKKILLFVLFYSLLLLHPFVPFITEEIYQKFPPRIPKFKKRKFIFEKKKKSIMEEKIFKL